MLDMTPHHFTIRSGEDTTVEVTNSRCAVPSVFSGDHEAYVVGRTDTEVAPLANITRAEIAVIASRFDEIGNATGVTFSDIYGHWAQHEIAIVARNGWVLGYEDGTFRPDQLVTRAEAMAMVNRVLQRIPQSGADLLPGMKIWSDNQDPNAWYYLTIQEATNSHGHDRRTSGYEYWTELREAPDWSWLERQWVPDRKDEGDRDVPPEGDRDMPEALPEEIPAQ